jgi:hypothetical protein
MIDKPEARRFPPPWSVNYPDSNAAVFHRSLVRSRREFSQIGIRWSRQQLGRPPLEVEGSLSVAAGARAPQ